MAHDPHRSSFIETDSAVYFDGRWHPLPMGGDGETDNGGTQPDQGGQEQQPAQPDGGQQEPQPDQGGAPAPAPDVNVEHADQVTTENSAPTLPSDLQTADEADLRTIAEQFNAHRVARRDVGDVVGARAGLDGYNAIRAELQRRVDAEAARQQELAAIDAEAAAIEPLPAPLPAPTPTSPLAGAGATAAQLAAAGRPAVPAAGVTNAPPQTGPERPRVTMLASAGTNVAPAGEPISWEQLGQAIDRAKTGRGSTTLMNIPSFSAMQASGQDVGVQPLSHLLGTTVNDEMIAEAVRDWDDRVHGREPRQGAICGPYDIIRDIPDAFVTDMPVAAIFPSRPAGRGGFTFTPSGTLADVAGGANLWNEADQAAVDPDDSTTWKKCIDYDCPESQDALLEAIYACVRYDITLEMSNPERVRNLNNALGAVEARLYEGRILQRIDDLSHGYMFAGEYGALPSIIDAINTLVAQLTYKDRQRAGEYVLIVPPGVRQILAIDRANRAYGTEEGASDDVMNYLRSNLEGVRAVVDSLDVSLSGEPGVPFHDLVPVNNQQSTLHSVPYISGSFYRLRLVDPSAAIYAETGEMNAGVMRDSGLIRQNKTAFFRERFFFLEKHGPQPWASIDVRLCADGSRAGLIEPDGCLVS